MKTANSEMPRLVNQNIEKLRIHPILTQFNQVMDDEDRESLSADIKLRGIVNAIHVNENGDILDGVHRFESARGAGLDSVPTLIFSFKSEEEEQLHVYKANMMRKKISSVVI